MPTNEERTCELRGLKTYQVLDAIQAGATKMPQIVKATGLSYRTVNALIYALEKQRRVLAQDYGEQRCNQCFAVIQYDANTNRQHSRIALEHPAKGTRTKNALENIQRLQTAFFFKQTPSTASSSCWA